MSILLTNLDINYDAWRAELPKEEEDETEDGSKNEKENTEVCVHVLVAQDIFDHFYSKSRLYLSLIGHHVCCHSDCKMTVLNCCVIFHEHFFQVIRCMVSRKL